MAIRGVESHAHTDAVYRVIFRREGEFSVEMLAAGSSPAMISSFRTELDADTWIANHKAEVAKGAPKRRSYKQAQHWLHHRRTRKTAEGQS